MNSFYLDASALAKRHAPELGSVLVDYLLASVPANRLYLFNVSMGEVVSILVRKRNAGLISAARLSQALFDFEAEIVRPAALQRVAADDALVEASFALIQTHSINATDAIILQSALSTAVALRAANDDLVLVASDLRLLRAAQAEGLAIFNPETQSRADLSSLI